MDARVDAMISMNAVRIKHRYYERRRGMNVPEFAVLMQKKLDENSGKGHWSMCSMQYLFSRLAQETGELSRANKKKFHPDQIDREAADVANFAMMIADNYREAYEDASRG